MPAVFALAHRFMHRLWSHVFRASSGFGALLALQHRTVRVSHRWHSVRATHTVDVEMHISGLRTGVRVTVWADSYTALVRSEWLVGDLGSRVAYQLDFILRSA